MPSNRDGAVAGSPWRGRINKQVRRPAVCTVLRVQYGSRPHAGLERAVSVSVDLQTRPAGRTCRVTGARRHLEPCTSIRCKWHAKVDSRTLHEPITEHTHLEVNTTFAFGGEVDRVRVVVLDKGELRLGQLVIARVGYSDGIGCGAPGAPGRAATAVAELH